MLSINDMDKKVSAADADMSGIKADVIGNCTMLCVLEIIRKVKHESLKSFQFQLSSIVKKHSQMPYFEKMPGLYIEYSETIEF